MSKDFYNEDEPNYRKKAFELNASNNGWYECPRCHKKFRKKDMDVDHIIPKSKGGPDYSGNLQLLCYHCNRSKGAKEDHTGEDLLRAADRDVQLKREAAALTKDFLRYLKKKK